MADISKALKFVRSLPPAENSRLTQIATTGPSYRKALSHLERAGIEGRAIDYGAGRGHGLREIGADTFEPYPQGWSPTYTKPDEIPDEVYRRLVNLNVLNVLDPQARESAVLNMGRIVEPGGGGVISTRGRDVMSARGEPGPEPMSLIIGEGDSARYQKGFTPRELREYVGDTLGSRFDIEPSDVGQASIMFRRNREDGGEVSGDHVERADGGKIVRKALDFLRANPELKPYRGGSFSLERQGVYDPRFFDLKKDDLVDDAGNIIASRNVTIPRENFSYDLPAQADPNKVFRGMSAEEFANFQKNQYIQSFGTHNIGEAQKGLTYFSVDPSEARSYAHSFAPSEFKPDPSRPAYVVAIKRPPEESIVRVPGTGESEVGVTGQIPRENVTNVYRGDVVDYIEGIDELGAKVSPRSSVYWKEITDYARGGHVEGGRLLEDEYPTHYLPNVGRQVMADGGETAQSRRRATLEQLGAFEDRPVMDPATMGENWASAVRRFRENPVREGEATMRPLELGARDVIGGAIAGDGGIVRSRIADIVAGSRGLPGSGTLGMGLADLTPAGIPLAISDFSDALRNEDYLSAGLSAGLPAAYYARKPIMAAGRAVYDAGRRAVDTARDVLGRVPAPVAAGGAGAAVMAPEEAEASKLNLVRRGLEAARGVRAYHGSPHDFDRFDLSKIGTGEGAQAYGHGLYFAENEGVARGYRDQLSGNRYVPKIPSNEIAQKYGEDVANIFKESAGSRGDITRTLARLQNIVARDLYDAGVKKISDIDGSFNPLFAEELRKLNDRADRLASLVRSKDVDLSKGHMYEVNIRANPEQFLDWDKPLAQQNESVRKAFLKAQAGDDPLLRELLNTSPEGLMMQGIMPGAKGSAAYKTMALDDASPLRASQRLLDAGIPGIRYLDAGSRGAGEGSSNYVVFDDKLIDILRKYGIPVMASGAGAAAMGEGREQ